MATHSDFSRFEERVEETIDTRFERFEAKIDSIGAAITRLMVFEERQAQQSKLSEEIARQVAANRETLEQRAAAMAERFDKRIVAAEEKHAALRMELHGYVQRWLGIAAVASIVAGSGFALLLRLVH